MTEPLKDHKIVPENEWFESRKALLKKEKEFTISRDQLSQQRRDLPWMAVNKEYVFEGPNGKQTLSELFDGKSQLIVYHFMFDPSWEAACLHCSFWADNFNGIIVHLEPKRCDHDRCFSGPIQQASRVPEADGLGFQMGFLLAIQISISITTCHSNRKSWPRKKPSTTSLHKTRTVQSGKE
jgi:predicted dithiol-disulfide oxidoreductase (DUF899 family)